jgi:ribosome-associated protein
MSEDIDDRGPSKSSRKREHRELQTLAESLAALPETRFRKLPLGERTRDALEAARRMARSGSRNRQIRLIAQLLLEEDIEALSRPPQELAEKAREEAARHHAAEKLRERLLEAGITALDTTAATPEQREQARGLLHDASPRAPSSRSVPARRALYRLALEILATG